MNCQSKQSKTCKITSCPYHGPSPIPQEGNWSKLLETKDICGLSHGVGKCAPQQGACKLTLNVKNGIVEEALVETLGCSGMTHSAAMAGEILPGKTILECLNTDLVCDAINDAMKQIFLQLVYGRSQTAFSKGGLPVGSSIEDLGENKCSQIGTIFSTKDKGVRYMQTVEGYILSLALDENNEVIGYKYVNPGLLIRKIKGGQDPQKAWETSIKTYGRFDEGISFIDPREN